MVKNLPVSAGDTGNMVQSLGLGDSLEEDMATHSSFLAWKIPRTEEPGGLQSTGSQRVGHDLATEHTIKYHFERSTKFEVWLQILTLLLTGL